MAVVISMTLTGRNEVRVDRSRPLLNAVYPDCLVTDKGSNFVQAWRARTHRIYDGLISRYIRCVGLSVELIAPCDATAWYLALTSTLVRNPFRAVVVSKHLSVWRINRWLVYYAALFSCITVWHYYANPASIYIHVYRLMVIFQFQLWVLTHKPIGLRLSSTWWCKFRISFAA